MGAKITFLIALFMVMVQERILNVKAIEDQQYAQGTINPTLVNKLEPSILNISHPNGSKDNNNNLSRVKRQYSYGRDRYYPIPIIFGGFGYPAYGPRGFGPRGYGGRGFGGRGFGGRGFGGRGIGGRGIGGRGIGGIGGRGVGGGHGGRG